MSTAANDATGRLPYVDGDGSDSEVEESDDEMRHMMI
jgi:hypothetical protein